MIARCDRCRSRISAHELRMGWPVSVDDPESEDPTQDEQQLCPSCYGDDAYCVAGHLLRGDDDSGRCGECEGEDS